MEPNNNKFYEISGVGFRDVSEFYEKLQASLHEQGISVFGDVTNRNSDGTPASEMRASGISYMGNRTGHLVQMDITLNRTHVQGGEFFSDFHFRNAIVRAVGSCDPGKLEKAIEHFRKVQKKTEVA